MNEQMAVRVVAFDLDGTLTQHKTPLGAANRAVLDALGRRYTLLMAGAGMCRRIYDQLGQYPVEILGNYGMQQAVPDAVSGELRILRDDHRPCDRDSVERRVTALRRRYGYTAFTGENVEYHASGCVTIPLLGTAARPTDKLAFDPTREKRRRIYDEVKALFPDYTVFVGGTSSFDMAPAPYDKYYALDTYCRERGLSHDELVYVGDDYGPGGNDEAVFRSDFRCLKIDDYRTLGAVVRPLLTDEGKDDSHV